MSYRPESSTDRIISKMKGLWSRPQDNTGSIRGRFMDIADANSSARNAPPEVAEKVEEILLFPTFAYRDDRLKVWRVHVHGWSFSPDTTTSKVRLATSAMRRLIGVQKGDEADALLLERISYLFANPPGSTDMVQASMAGIGEPEAFELRKTSTISTTAPLKPPRRNIASVDSPEKRRMEQPINLMDSPIVLDPNFTPSDPNALRNNNNNNNSSNSSNSNQEQFPYGHDKIVKQPPHHPETDGTNPNIAQKALQLDAFSWQTLVINEGLFQGEILVGYNELQWLIDSYDQSHPKKSRPSNNPEYLVDRRLIELRGRLYGWKNREIGGVAHLVEPTGISVISDIDDTIKASNITESKRIVLETVFARPLLAVPGMADLYRKWYNSGAEFHYVSNSPWQLYPSLDGFFHENKFPPGSAHLRSFDPNELFSISNFTGTPQMKRDTIEWIFSIFPNRKYIFVGDCGEGDLETYTDLARRFPDRVLRIYIRDLFSPMSVPSITTDTATAGSQAHMGAIGYGVVEPSSMNTSIDSRINNNTDLIQLAESNTESARSFTQTPMPPPIPPKPAGLKRTTSQTPPPKPPRSQAWGQPPSRVQQLQREARSYTGGSPSNSPPGSVFRESGSYQYNPPPPTPPRYNMNASTSSSYSNVIPGTYDNLSQNNAAFRLAHLREQAQSWLAFYAQMFYVNPTQSFNKYKNIFLPTVEANPYIIRYDEIPEESSDTTSSSSVSMLSLESSVSTGITESKTNTTERYLTDMYNNAVRSNTVPNMPRNSSPQSSMTSMSNFDIPEPPPPESQLTRNNRRLLLWKRYLVATKGLNPDVCRLFVDAKDILADSKLMDDLVPRFAKKDQTVRQGLQ